jgi:hypothetical protein
MSASDGPIYFNAMLRPNSPMSPQARRCIVAAVAAIKHNLRRFLRPSRRLAGDTLSWERTYCCSRGRPTPGAWLRKRREEVRLTESVLRVDCFPGPELRRNLAGGPWNTRDKGA